MPTQEQEQQQWYTTEKVCAVPELFTEPLTFFFTDIEGSTRLWEQYPEAMRRALARHDALLQQAIEAGGGKVFKTIGDAFCAVFPSAENGLSAAVAAQRALHNEPWEGIDGLRVRMALHTGLAEERGNDFFGPTVNRVARFLSAAHGGQILLSQPTFDQVRERLPDGFSLRDLDEHRLKDLSRPERIFQLVCDGLPSEFPPLRSLEAFAHNLPTQLTTFIGREREIGEIKERLAGSHLLTLTGPGGCGKSRLALQVAADVADEFAQGVWLVELAPLSDPELIAQTVASVVGIREQAGRPLLDTLIESLRSKTLLLLLDNCEHLIEACARLADRLLRACPNLRILTSSRQPLGIPGEMTYPVPSLRPPNPSRLPPLEDLRHNEAIRLFMERASYNQPSFALSSGNALPVTQICHRLDGIPLAIELAAARVKVLSPEQIAARLDDRFRLLTGGSRAALPRQQTLRALIDWSYELLEEPERVLLRRLAVFSGGWTLEAAEAVCEGEPLESWEVLDFLSNLVDKSLVSTEEDRRGETRYRLLQTVRQYAKDRQQEAGEADEVAARHRDWFLRLACDAEQELLGAEQALWLDRLEAEHDNLRAALEDACRNAPGDGLRAAGALLRFWSVRGYYREGRDWLGRLLSCNGPDDAPAEARAKALRAAGALACNQGDYPAARESLEESLALFKTLGDKRGAAGALNTSGNVAWLQGDFGAARRLYEESLSFGRELGDRRSIGVALISLGNVAVQQGDYPLARTRYEEALTVCRQIGNREWEAATLQNLGDTLWNQDDMEAARKLYEEARALRHELGDRRGVGISLNNLGNVAREQGDFERARSLYEEALATCREMGDRQWEAINLSDIGEMYRKQGDFAAARDYHIQSLTIRRELKDKWGIAGSLRNLALVEASQQRWRRAVLLFSAAESIRQAIDVKLPPKEQAEFDRKREDARATLGDETFTAAWDEGAGMDMEAAVGYALFTTE